MPEYSSIQQGASFLKVLCGGEGCYKHAERWLYNVHNGSDSSGGTPVTPEQLSEAYRIANEHEQATGHTTRIVEGKLEGVIYP
jgi:hypothetical protein